MKMRLRLRECRVLSVRLAPPRGSMKVPEVASCGNALPAAGLISGLHTCEEPFEQLPILSRQIFSATDVVKQASIVTNGPRMLFSI